MAAIIPFIPLIVGAIGGGAAVYSAKSQGSAQKRSLAVESQYTDQAIAEQRRQDEYQRQQDALDRQRQAEQDRLQAAQIQRDIEQREWERRRLEQQMANDLAAQRWNQSFSIDTTNQQRRAYGDFVQTLEPYRSAGVSANNVLASLLGIKVPKYTGGNYYDLAANASVPVNIPQ